MVCFMKGNRLVLQQPTQERYLFLVGGVEMNPLSLFLDLFFLLAVVVSLFVHLQKKRKETIKDFDSTGTEVLHIGGKR